jgi:aminopeptidase N
LSNPNRARSLLSSFGLVNHYRFHDKSGSGYQFLADCIQELDKINPQVAARMMTAFAQWKKFEHDRKEMMKSQLERIKATEHLSPDTFEIVSRYLK